MIDKNSKTSKSTHNPNSATVEVLYQKMGTRWYAFSVVGEEVFFAPVPDDALNADGNPAERQHSDIGAGNRIGNT